MFRGPVLLTCALFFTLTDPVRAGADPAGIDFFERKIRPVLVERCYPCHSRAAKKSRGDLYLDSKESMRKGGENGPVLVPGDVKSSLILKMLRRDVRFMPPAGKLPDGVIADFEKWVQMGAPDPRTTSQAHAIQEGPLWSLKPARRPEVPGVKNTAWPRNAIDRFILARLEREGLEPAKEAERLALLRRVTFGLTGLPPTPEQMREYLQDCERLGQTAAFAREVDRLLASPHFGERWARHWMDLVCYSETHGIEHDPLIPHAWRYRDYLIRAFNDDVPYDRFVKEHLAGDLLPPRWYEGREGKRNEALVGTACFRFVELYPTPVDVKNEEMSVLEMQIDTFGKTFQGLTIACARCHDHKFDPITARDYHALYGIFASSRLTMRHLDDPARFHTHDAELASGKREIRAALANRWREQVSGWKMLLPQVLIPWPTKEEKPAEKKKDKTEKKEEPKTDAERWTLALRGAVGQPQHPLFALANLAREKAAFDKDFPTQWQKLAAQQTVSRPDTSPAYKLFADFTRGDALGWYVHGEGLDRGSVAGDFAVAARGPGILTGIYPRGRYSHLLSDRHPSALRSPNFTLAPEIPEGKGIRGKCISALVCGTNDARLRLIIENFPGDELLFGPVMPRLKNGALHWVTLPIRDRWEGRRAYLEVIPHDDMTYAGRVMDAATLDTDGRSGVGIRKVVFHDQPAAPELPSPLASDFWKGHASGAAVIERFTALVADAVNAWETDRCSDEQAMLLDALSRAGVLTNREPDGKSETEVRLKTALSRVRTLESNVPVAQRVPGFIEEEGFDTPFFPRGSYQRARGTVPRRYLEALHGKPYRLTPGQSGRLALAEDIASPHNPLTARVMVNRLWQHLFGAGLVRSVDNFGHLGETPSHPELLDWLAAEFVEQGWSVKQLIRVMVTSRVYALGAEASQSAREKDADNRLWSHASLRRLDAESLRDAMLTVSGRLDRTQFGLGIPLPVAPFKDFYLPVAGPIDGRGRRSVYLEVRRNFLSPFMLTFDQPRPIATTGQRSVTNVPAQGLALQNDPFVLQMAEGFAQRVLASVPAGKEAGKERIDLMYRLAFGRSANSHEVESALAFARQQAESYGPGVVWETDPRVWRDLAHALFNFKEFIFLR